MSKLETVNLSVKEIVRLTLEADSITAKATISKADEMRHANILATISMLRAGVSPQELAAATVAGLRNELGIKDAPAVRRRSAEVEQWRAFLNGNEVESESTDVTNRDDIRMHLRHIARAFQTGDFDIPMFVHDRVPPGVPEMKRLQKHIRYVFEETPNGGRVVISSTDKHALNAIHSFLRFQIEEHKTGGPVDVH
jgi:hypothetical protein